MPTKLKQLAALTLTSGGTAEALSSTPIIVQSVLIIAAATNSGTVYVGDSDVTSTNGIPLAAEGHVRMTGPALGKGGASDLDLAQIYWDGTTSDVITVSYLQSLTP